MGQPRDWCHPPEAFGNLRAETREWLPPRQAPKDHPDWAIFRAAVLQNAICLHVRQFKNQHGIAQEQLARSDVRPDSQKKWNARLCGRINLSMRDMATLMTIVPGALPTEAEAKTFLDVAEGKAAAPDGWRWVDTAR